jgi:hypothetical protein
MSTNTDNGREVKSSWLSSSDECERRLALYKEAAEKGTDEWSKIVPATVDSRTPDLRRFPRREVKP